MPNLRQHPRQFCHRTLEHPACSLSISESLAGRFSADNVSKSVSKQLKERDLFTRCPQQPRIQDFFCIFVSMNMLIMRQNILYILISCLLVISCSNGTSRAPLSIRKWQREHRVPEKIIQCRIESAQKDSLILKDLALEEMTINACLLINGMPTEMYEYGDTIDIHYAGPEKEPADGCTYTFVRNLFYSYTVD